MVLTLGNYETIFSWFIEDFQHTQKLEGGLIKRTIRSLLNLLFRCGLSSLRRDSTALYKYETVERSHKEQVKLVLWWGFAECCNRKALRLKAQGVYSCK